MCPHILDTMTTREHVPGSPPGLDELREALRKDGDFHVRQMAAILLGSLRDAGDTERLITALRDEEKSVRQSAMEGLAATGAPAVPRLTAALQDDDWIVRYRAAEALGRIGDVRAVEPLISALGDGKDHVRHMAAKGLGMLCDPSAAGPLEALLSDSNEYVRQSAAMALGRIGGDGC